MDDELKEGATFEPLLIAIRLYFVTGWLSISKCDRVGFHLEYEFLYARHKVVITEVGRIPTDKTSTVVIIAIYIPPDRTLISTVPACHRHIHKRFHKTDHRTRKPSIGAPRQW